MKHLIIVMVVIMTSCQATKKDEHPHNPDGSHISEDVEVPTVDYTLWTDNTELFVEFPVLIVGHVSRFAAHFTVLHNHQPVRAGSVTVSLVSGDKGIRNTAEAPASEGIFKPTLQPKVAGVYQLIFDIKTPTLSDRIVIKDVEVYKSLQEATADHSEAEKGGQITFLKEQAWKMEFHTDRVSREIIYTTIPTAGIWKTSTSNFKTLVATSRGSVVFPSFNLTAGRKVKKGQTLLTITSSNLSENNLATEIANAKSDYEQAKAAYDRKKQLYESKIVAKSEFEEVSQKYEVAKSNYETLTKGYTNGGKQIVAPFDGFIQSVSIENGQFVQQGAALISIITDKSSVLEAQVSSEYTAQLQELKDVWYQPKMGVWSSLIQTGGKILSVGKSVQRDQPMLSVFAQVNEVVLMPEGSFCEMQLAFGNGKETKVIPTSALLEDYGNYSVIVQLSGESFERRSITIGARNGTKVEVLAGLEWGEVVVSKGAYQVKMASMSGSVPAHGHSH
ncbi:MAG: cobalt-zinc-cadmium efflux system membrane fusion protein [Bacteroidia bacterium]|jgi:cobalt-zinc-cadmium efflux system membrane fusion protein